MRIPANILIDTPIIYSQKGIVVENSAEITAQLFADSIVVKSKSTLRYPSVVATLSGPGNKTVQIETGAHIEGTVLSFSGNDQRTPGLVTIHPGAEVTGLVYAEDRLTLDGSVRGIVIAKDFYFYEAPTTYLGWIRSGTIDRSRLPNSFLLPLGVSSSPQYEVLDWL
jgi:cytoskeletal protein CcmA (bactofilin family)